MFEVGSISTGTLRVEDVLPRFAAELDRQAGRITMLAQHARNVDPQGPYALETLGDLTEALQGYCPPFVYFGTRQCQGCSTNELCSEAKSDFGFWPDWDALNKEIGYHNLDEFWLDEYQCMVEVYPENNVMVSDISGNVIWHTQGEKN